MDLLNIGRVALYLQQRTFAAKAPAQPASIPRLASSAANSGAASGPFQKLTLAAN
jgi:hypothetical protein